MDQCKYNKYVNCYSSQNKMLGSNKTSIDLNSNFLMKFDLDACLPLPKDVKIEILETKLTYNICKVEKNILLNGHTIESDSSSLKDEFYLKKEYCNLGYKECRNILFNITELIKLKVCICLEIKALAHTENTSPILINAVGNTEDCIETILMTKDSIPNFKNTLDNIKICLENNLTSMVTPDYIFLSPIYDDCLDIDSFIGNVYINYCLGLSLCSYVTINTPCHNPYSKNKNSYFKVNIKK